MIRNRLRAKVRRLACPTWKLWIRGIAIWSGRRKGRLLLLWNWKIWRRAIGGWTGWRSEVLPQASSRHRDGKAQDQDMPGELTK
jgi:hypothetical protein